MLWLLYNTTQWKITEKGPGVVTPITITSHSMTYEILAYREVIGAEVKAVISAYLRGHPTPSTRETVQVVTVFGHSD
jgi:hypothetical protein